MSKHRTDNPSDEISLKDLDRVMKEAAKDIPDEKVTRADGTIDGAKLIEEMFGPGAEC